jgi:hypothetical protein
MMDLNYHVLPGSVGTLEVAHDINDAGHILCSARSGPRVDPVLLVPTRWKLRDIAFLQGVSWILGGEDDGPGWVIVPGRGPRPVPPWVRELWRSLSPSARARVTAIASRDPVRLLDEPALHRELQRIVPRLSEVEEGP